MRPHGKWMPLDDDVADERRHATRPCLISAWRRKPIEALLAGRELVDSTRFIGSQKPRTGLSFSASVLRSAAVSILTEAARDADDTGAIWGAKADAENDARASMVFVKEQ